MSSALESIVNVVLFIICALCNFTCSLVGKKCGIVVSLAKSLLIILVRFNDLISFFVCAPVRKRLSNSANFLSFFLSHYFCLIHIF